MQAKNDSLSALKHQSKEELAYRQLRSAILSNLLKPGERLMHQDLARQFNVSTMPVRQALTRLELDRLAVRTPNGGLIVAPLSIKEIEEIYTLRADLEALAARLATPKLRKEHLRALAALVEKMKSLVAAGDVDALVEQNVAFHFTIYRAADNELLYGILENLWDRSSRYRGLYYRSAGVPEETIREHQGILSALQKGDALEASDLVRLDMEETARVLLGLIRRNMNSDGGINGEVPVV